MYKNLITNLRQNSETKVDIIIWLLDKLYYDFINIAIGSYKVSKNEMIINNFVESFGLLNYNRYKDAMWLMWLIWEVWLKSRSLQEFMTRTFLPAMI